MKLETAQAIAAAAEQMGKDVNVKESYSGRGMFGKTTAAVTGDWSDILGAIARACYQAGRDAVDAESEGDRSQTPQAEEMVREIRRLAQDSYGLDVIVY